MKKILLAAMVLGSFQVFGGATCDNANLSAWSVTNNPDAGALAVTQASAMGGTACGLEISSQGGGSNFVQDSNPNGEQRYRGRFIINPNGINLPVSGFNRRVKFHLAQCTAGAPPCRYNAIVQFKLGQQSVEGYVLEGFVVDVNAAADGAKRFRVDIADIGETAIEYDVDLTNGTFKLWMDATSEADPVAMNVRVSPAEPIDYSGLDMSDWAGGVSRARVGFTNTPAAVPVGEAIYFDEFESRRQTFIGQ